jgi:hypothetical protein
MTPPPSRCSQALDVYHIRQDLSSLEETRCVCHFLFQLSLFKHQWRFATPSLHSDLMERLIYLTGSAAAFVSSRSELKRTVKTLNAAGLLAPEDGPLGRRGRDQGCATTVKDSSPRPSLSWMHDEYVDEWVWPFTSMAAHYWMVGVVTIYVVAGQWLEAWPFTCTNFATVKWNMMTLG